MEIARGALVRAVVLTAAGALGSWAVLAASGESADDSADIGGGLVPLGLVLLIALGWSLLDARSHGGRPATQVWVAAVLLFVVILSVVGLIRGQGTDTFAGSLIYGVLAGFGCVLGLLIGQSLRETRPPLR